MKKFIPGILVSILFIYLSLKDTDYQGVIAGLAKIGYVYILLFLFVSLFMQIIRTWRWRLIINPLGSIDYLTFIAVANVGFLAIIALPARLGELGRPYLLSRNSRINMPTALGTVFVERMFDGVAILTITSLIPFFAVLPKWLIEAGIIFFIINIVLISSIFFAVFRRDMLWKFLSLLLGFLPDACQISLRGLLAHFLDGLGIIKNGKQLIYIMMLSFIFWISDVIAIYILFMAFKFVLPPVAAFVLMLILIIGIAIPTAPGFIGNWHYSCVLGLGLFGIAKTDALTFAVIYHFCAVGLVIIIGLGFLPFLNLSFTNLCKEAKDIFSFPR